MLSFSDKSYDQFGYISKENFSIYLDSKENFFPAIINTMAKYNMVMGKV